MAPTLQLGESLRLDSLPVVTTFDPREALMHEIVASMRFPGPDYYEVLRWLHEDLRPESYLEIGVYRGQSLRLAMPPTVAVGIDPSPEVRGGWRAKTHLLVMSSSEFFATHRLSEFFGSDRFSLAFVDGLHRFEQAVEEIFTLEAYADLHSLIAVHDTIPLDQKTSARERRSRFHTGDVWKIVPFLRRHRPDLAMITVRTKPSGMTLIRGLNPAHHRVSDEIEGIDWFRNLPWDYYKERRNEFLETIPNERAAILSWLGRQNHD